jgi:putative endonuclease
MYQAHYLGQTGEEAALNYLKDRGYTIRELNWRYRRIEVDILAETADCLVVVEVKTRRNTLFKDPSQAVDYAKIRRLVMAAHAYVNKHRIHKEVRFDVVSVVSMADGFRVEHIPDAFVPPVE